MKEIKDINFGIKKWYLMPTFYIKIGAALFSLILLIVLFVLSANFSDSLWKEIAGKSQLIFSALLVVCLIVSVLGFLFYFYKIFPDYSIHCFFLSLATTVIYLILVFFFAIFFGSKSRQDMLSSKINDFIVQNENDKKSIWFKNKYKVTEKNLKECIQKYVSERTSQASKLIIIFSMIWLIFVAFLFFVTLFENGDDSTGENTGHFYQIQ